MQAARNKTHRYSVEVKFDKRAVKPWWWEIKRSPELGVRLYCEGFFSEYLARLAGEKALGDLLKAVSNEELND